MDIMEVDNEDQDSTTKTHKNPINDPEENKSNKKQKLFSAKQFRKQLNSGDKLEALNNFLSAINSAKNHDYVYDYLEAGGSCLEILQTLEHDSSITPAVAFNLVTQILLRISAKYAAYQSAAFESCRYLINNYITVIHKMLGLSSSKEERKVCLKLLSALVTFSPNLAKDVLLNVKFHSANIELLTKHTGEADSVRDCFIHFLTAFLVDGHHQTLSILLEKSSLLTSIVRGLQYDAADTVCVIISAMKNHILENTSVSKTSKMTTFNTGVVKDVVNLYNWKGPRALILEAKKKSAVFEVNKYEKSKVSECVHQFLLTLCTSHKFGVIFKDPLVGLGKKNQNSLMYTVLVSLERPWEHSYAGELVVKICKACPDLTKNLWSILKPSLEPRMTEKWLAAMKFAKTILLELPPECVEGCVGELNEFQVAQVIQVLVAPTPIIKVICPENTTYEDTAVKYHVISVLLEMLKRINDYINSFKKLITNDIHKKLKTLVSNFICKNFPNAEFLLKDWDGFDEMSEIKPYDYLAVAFDILDLYKSLSPQLLETLSIESLNLQEFLNKIENCANLNEEKLSKLQTKVVGIVLELDYSNFLPNTEMFSFVLPLLLKVYHKYTEESILNVLNKLFKASGIFDLSYSETNIWINGILNTDNLDDSLLNMLVEIIKETTEHLILYQEQVSKYQGEYKSSENHADIIETLLSLDLENENSRHIVRNTVLSPLIIVFLKYLTENDTTKSIRKYGEFVILNVLHLQSFPEQVTKLVIEYQNVVSSHIVEYCNGWSESNPTELSKFKGKFSEFKKFSKRFLNGEIDVEFLKLFSSYPESQLNLLQTATFYFSNLTQIGKVAEHHTQNFDVLVKFMINNGNFINAEYLKTLFENMGLLQQFSILRLNSSKSAGVATRFLISVIKELMQNKCDLKRYLDIYSDKIYQTILKTIKKGKTEKISGCREILNTFNLEYYQCVKIVSYLNNTLTDSNDTFVFDILCYIIKRLSDMCLENSSLEPLNNEFIKRISVYFANLNNSQNFDVVPLSQSLSYYLDVFHHQIEFLDDTLFKSLLLLNEYKKENVDFCVFLLERDHIKYTSIFRENIDSIFEKKGVILPLTQVLIKRNVNEDILKEVYEKIDHSILKALQKPQKVGQHFHKGYDAHVLVEKFMPIEKCKSFVDKVQKFEVTEAFHAKLLQAICNKVLECEVSDKVINNIILTFIHLEMNLFKRGIKNEEETEKLNSVSTIFSDILLKLIDKVENKDLKNTSQSEVLKTFCKFCLKFGVSKHGVLLKILKNIIIILKNFLEQDDAQLILEMLTSHSEFLDVVLVEHSSTKLDVFSLFLILCENWNGIMERNHVAMLLSAYNAKVTPCDRVILRLLRIYDSKAEQTRFYDFKPFLWGRAAATHYSVRMKIENAIIRQPKTGDVLDLLKEELVNSTILHYPLNDHLSLDSEKEVYVEEKKCYDLVFLLPLFSHILAPEQQVKTYQFTRSGALSLSVIGLSSQNEDVRQAACHVLSRLHFHLESKHVGKDNLLWVRYVEALSKGTAVLPGFRLNNFAAIFFAKMALILTQPRHVMYYPLSRYLSAKSELDFSTVPELYTLLHSSDVNFKEHRTYILEILRDGLRTEKDFNDFSKSMAYKLFSELYSSCLSDLETKLLILEVFESVVKIPLGVKVLCENHSFLTQLYCMTQNILLSEKNACQFPGIIKICNKLAHARKDRYSCSVLNNILFDILKNDYFVSLKDDIQDQFFESLYVIFVKFSELFTDGNVAILLEKTSDRFCKYVSKHGCQYATEDCLRSVTDKYSYLRLLFFNKFKNV